MIMQFIQDIFYTIMNALLFPVMLILLGSLCLILYTCGRFLVECVFRKRHKADIEHIAFKISDEMSQQKFQEVAARIEAHLQNCFNESKELRLFLTELAQEITRGAKNLDIRVENVLQENETRIARLLDTTKVFVRLGPMLGLMGTLIPIGGALLALSIGDIAQMSNSLIIAFSTTVVGLAIGGLAYVISIARERWYEKDMKSMEFLAEIIMRDLGVIENGGCQCGS